MPSLPELVSAFHPFPPLAGGGSFQPILDIRSEMLRVDPRKSPAASDCEDGSVQSDLDALDDKSKLLNRNDALHLL